MHRFFFLSSCLCACVKLFCFYPAIISSVDRNIPAKLFTTFPVVSRNLLIDCEIGPSGRGSNKFPIKKGCKKLKVKKRNFISD